MNHRASLSIVLGLASLAGGGAKVEPSAGAAALPTPRYWTNAIGMKVADIEGQALATFLTARGLPAAGGSLRSVEAGIADRLVEAMRSLARDPSAEHFGTLGVIFDYVEWYALAFACYDKALAIDPNAFRWWYYSARVSALRGAPVEAETRFRRAIALQPRMIVARARLSRLLVETGRVDEARRELNEILEARPDYVFAWVELGRIALRNKEFERARGYLSRAAKIDPANGPAHALLSRVAALTGDREAAREFAKRSAPAGTELAVFADGLLEDQWRIAGCLNYYRGLARRQTATRQWADLVKSLKHIVEYDTRDVDTRLDLVAAYFETDRPEEARQTFESTMDLSKENPDVCALSAMVALSYAHAELALEWADRGLKTDASHAGANASRARSLAALGRPDAAIASAIRSLESDPTDVAMRDFLVTWLRKRGRDREAETWLERFGGKACPSRKNHTPRQ